ncbi:unannotated protein [freshwater metagenome]|uniref:Unannotated protein n=1 Tax=freshwater metagenome TaxID=449393 RepID=A0A6J7H3Y5_9ZZZZ
MLHIGQPQNVRPRRYVQIGAVCSERACNRMHCILVLLEVLVAPEECPSQTFVHGGLTATLDRARKDARGHVVAAAADEELRGGPDKPIDTERPAARIVLRETA